MTADPPFERAGASSRRLLLALVLTTTVALTALLTLLAHRAPDRGTVRIVPIAVVPSATAPEVFPAPREPAPRATSASPSDAAVRFQGVAPAAVAPGDRVIAPQLEALVEDPESSEGRKVDSGATLRSWDNFRLRFHLDKAAWVALWHIESQGKVQRIFPAPTSDRTMAQVAQVGWRTLPSGDRWFYLDDKRGREVFVLGVRTDAPPEDAEWLASVDKLERSLSRARRGAPRPAKDMVFRGIGGTRAPAGPDAVAATALVDELMEHFRGQYDEIRVLEFEHQ